MEKRDASLVNETLKPTTQYTVASQKPPKALPPAILPPPTHKERTDLFPSDMNQPDPMFPTQPPIEQKDSLVDEGKQEQEEVEVGETEEGQPKDS